MGGRWIIEGMILLLSISVIMVIWPGMRRFLLGFMRNSAVGLSLIWVVGLLLGAPYQVGLNLWSGSACGFLGLPGAILLVALKQFLS